MSVEDLLLGLSVLSLLVLTRKPLLEARWDKLDGNECSSLQLPKRSGADERASLVMIGPRVQRAGSRH